MQFDLGASEAFDLIAEYLEKPGNPIEEIKTQPVFKTLEPQKEIKEVQKEKPMHI